MSDSTKNQDEVTKMKRLISLIPYSPNGITGRDLAKALECNEREVRDLVSKAKETEVIVNFQDGRGYRRSTDVDEIKRYIMQESNRAKSIFRSLKGARQFVKGVN